MSAPFILVESTYRDEDYEKLYIDEIVRWHGSIIFHFGQGSPINFLLLRSFKKSSGTQVMLSTAFHHHKDGQVERTIHTLKDMLRACVIDFNGSCNNHFPLIECSYNNSYHSGIGMTPFKAVYVRRCRSPVWLFEVVESSIIGPEIILEAVENVRMIRYRLATAQSRKKSYVDNKKRALTLEVGDQVCLKISLMKGVMRFGKKGKLSHRYIGPYEILQRIGNADYELKLPNDLASMHPVFHVLMLKCVQVIQHPYYMLRGYESIRTFFMKRFQLKF